MKIKVPTSAPAPPQKPEKRGGEADLENRCYDSSCLTSFMRCPRYFLGRSILRLKENYPTEGRAAGYAFHEALAVLYEGGSLDSAIEELSIIPEATGDPSKNRAHMEMLLCEYMEERFHSDLLDWKVLAVEERFAIPMDQGRTFTGRIDLIIEWEGKIYGVDHKTTKSVAYLKNDYEAPHLQMDGYHFSIAKRYGSCAGMLLNGISTAMKPKERFLRLHPTRAPHLFPATFSFTAYEIETYLAQQYFPFKTANCSLYGGCTYKDLCCFGWNESIWSTKFYQDIPEEEEKEDAYDNNSSCTAM